MDENESRPLGLTLLTALYFFLFMVTISTAGNPFPFLGHIYVGSTSQLLIFADSILCLYLSLGLMKRQFFTWYLLLGYNLFEIGNTVINLHSIPIEEIEKAIGGGVNRDALFTNNIACALALLLLTQYIYRHKHFFTNRGRYLL